MMALRCDTVSANEASALFDVVGEGAPVGLAFVDTDLRYVRINAALAKINGRSVEYHLGRRVDDALPEFAGDLLPIYRQVLETGQPVLERELTGERPDGHVRHVVASWFPIRQAGTIAGVGVVVVDITARKAAEMRLEGVLRQLPVGVVIADADGRVMLTNGRLTEMGLATSPRGAQLAEQQAAFWRPDGTLYASEEWPLTRALQDGEVVRAEEMEFARPDGSRGVLEASAAPIRDAGGGVVAAVVVVQDVTERKRAAQRQELLVRAGEVLDSALGVDERLDRLARVLVPRLADFVKIELLEGQAGRRPVAIAHEDPEREALMRRLRERVTLGEEERVGMAATFATGESKLTREIVPAAVARSAGERAGADAAELMEAIGPRSQIVVPLRARGRVLGALSLTMAESGRHYVEEDLELARDLGLRAGLAVDNARLYEEEQRRAEQLDALAGASLAIHAKRSVGERLQLIADRARSMVGAERALVGMTIGRSEPVLAAAPAGAAEPLPEGGLAAAMIARDGSPLGTIGVAGKRVGFTVGDRMLLEDLARIAALAIENARLEELERHIARTLQGSLLPSSLPEIPGIDAAARYLPGGEGTVVGGDLYDLYAVDDEWALVVGDVCGKGAEAAALTGMVRYTIRAEAVHHSSPGEVLRLLNEAILRQNDDGRFCTVLHGRLHVGGADGVRLVIAGAGHPPPLVLRARGAVEAIDCNGPLLGIVDDVRAPDVTVELAPGDALVCFTDGVTEGRGPEGLYGDERLGELLAGSRGAAAGTIADRITQAVLDFQGGRTQDDLALLVLRVT
jgi:PAS domain S-box-containing protein